MDTSDKKLKYSVEDITIMKIEEKILNIITKIEYETISIKEEREEME